MWQAVGGAARAAGRFARRHRRAIVVGGVVGAAACVYHGMKKALKEVGYTLSARHNFERSRFVLMLLAFDRRAACQRVGRRLLCVRLGKSGSAEAVHVYGCAKII